MICIILKMRLKPDKVDGLLETMRRLIPEVRKEPGNHAYYFHRVPDDANSFVFYEQYEDEAALMAHRAHIAEYGIDMNNLGEMLVEPPDRQVYELFSEQSA